MMQTNNVRTNIQSPDTTTRPEEHPALAIVPSEQQAPAADVTGSAGRMVVSHEEAVKQAILRTG